MIVYSLGSDYQKLLSSFITVALTNVKFIANIRLRQSFMRIVNKVQLSFLGLFTRSLSRSESSCIFRFVTLRWILGVPGVLDDWASSSSSSRGDLLGILMITRDSYMQTHYSDNQLQNSCYCTLCWFCTRTCKPTIMRASVNCQTSHLWISLQRSWPPYRVVTQYHSVVGYSPSLSIIYSW